jgi:alkylhydroperoxidase family enzyme
MPNGQSACELLVDAVVKRAGNAVARSAASDMSDIEKAREALVQRILEGDGKASRERRRAAFDNRRLEGPLGTLVGKVAEHANMVNDDDIAAVRSAGLSEDEIFEIVVCAAIGQSARQYDAALAALDDATS